MWDLPPPVYIALQKMVHGDFSKQRRIIDGFRNNRHRNTLEIGCGTGLLSVMFDEGTYAGTDIDEQRIAMAKSMHPGHEFFVLDFTKDYSGSLERFDSILFHDCIHHIDNAGVRQLLDNVKAAVKQRGRPIELMIIEPVLPENVATNLPGFALAKMDRGKYVRKYDETVKLFGGNLISAVRLTGPWYWPVPGIAMNVEIN